MKMNKTITALTLALITLTGTQAFAKTKIVTTIFPEYDWVREIAGSKLGDVELTLLLDNGVDLHSYQPSVKDIAKISNADIFIYVGGESDEWVEDVLKTARNKNLTAVNLLEVLGDSVKEEELVEGMQAEDEHDHDADDDEEEPEYDEHVWLSLRNAKVLCKAIADVMCEKDPLNASLYRENLSAYTQKLSALDVEYEKAVNEARIKTLVFGDRFPFRYLTDDYGLKYYAAFAGCSAETEASFKTVAFLSNKVKELMPGAVCTIEKSDGKIAGTVIAASKQKNVKLVALDSMQSTTTREAKKGETYLGIMKKNLESLKTALN